MDRGRSHRLVLLGAFGLFAPDGRRIEIASKKANAMLALLALAPKGIRSRVWLQSMLWGSRAAEQAQSSLRRELSTLCRTLTTGGADGLIVREGPRVRLALDRIEVDALAIEAGSGRGLGICSDFLEGLDLPDCEEFEDWLRAQRVRFDVLQRMVPDSGKQGAATSETILGEPFPAQPARYGDSPRVPPKPSVAVLPFIHLGRDEHANWLGAGIAEEVSMTLTQFPQLFVVAAGSAATLVERRLTHVEIARELGVRYLLGGSIRQAERRLKVAASLLDGQSGLHVWGCTVDGTIDDIFGLQEVVALKIVPQIWTQIDLAERYRILRQPARPFDRYELYWRANALFRQWDREATLEAIRLTDELTALDPTCAFAAALAGFCNGIAFLFGWTTDRRATRDRADAFVRIALEHGRENVEALGYVAGTLILIGGDLLLADRIIGYALSLLPSHQPTLFWGGWVDIAHGRPNRARERFDLALRINPASGARAYALVGIGVTQLLSGDDEGAYRALSDAAVHVPRFPAGQAALSVAAARTGRVSEAQAAAEALKCLGGLGHFSAILRNDMHKALVGSSSELSRPSL